MEQWITHLWYFIVACVGLFFVYLVFMVACGLLARHSPTHKAIRSYVDPDDDNLYQEDDQEED